MNNPKLLNIILGMALLVLVIKVTFLGTPDTKENGNSEPVAEEEQDKTAEPPPPASTKQVSINKNFIPPMPVCVMGTKVDDKENFMAVGWCARANFKPAMIAVGIGKTHHSTKGVLKNKQFSLCFPGSSQHVVTDYVGIVSGQDVDKSRIFDTFTGTSENAPMIKSFPVNLECELVKAVELDTNYVFIGKIVNAYGREDILDKGKVNFDRFDPLVLTMPNNRYWKLGEHVGDAWKDGRKYKDFKAKNSSESSH